MGRKGKAKKLTATSQEDPGSGEEEKIPVQKRRGRPQKPLRDEFDDQVVGKMEEGDNENKDSSTTTVSENGRGRKRNSPTKEENMVGETLVAEVSNKPNGFRHVGSRRKNKPRRAAEVGVECW